MIRDRLVSFVKYYFVFSLAWFSLASSFSFVFFLLANFCFFFFYYFSYKIRLFSKSNEFFSLAFFRYSIKLVYLVFESSKECVNIIFNEYNIDRSIIKKINVSSLNQEERVLFSNIITMTPGTFVISTNNDDYYIHSMDARHLDGLNIEKIREIILGTRKKISDKDG